MYMCERQTQKVRDKKSKRDRKREERNRQRERSIREKEDGRRNRRTRTSGEEGGRETNIVPQETLLKANGSAPG